MYFFFLKYLKTSLHPKILSGFPSQPKENHQTFPFSAWSESFWKISNICEALAWETRPTTLQQMFFLCYEESGLCLQHASSPVRLSDWQDSSSWLGVAADLRPARTLFCKALQDSLKYLLPWEGNLFFSWRYKRANLFPCTLYHTKHISIHEKTPTLFERKINWEASSLDFQRKSIVATFASVCLGNSGGSKDSPHIISQPGNEVILQGIMILFFFFLYKIHTMVVQFEKPPFSSHS